MKAVKRIFIALASLLYVGILVLIGFSWPGGGSGGEKASAQVPSILGPDKVIFTAGKFPVDATELVLKLESGETALLDSFESLVSADFSGSSCYDEIDAWSRENPQVSVKYTIAFPNGVSVDNHSESLDLSGIDAGTADEAIGLMAYLPSLSSIELGDIQPGSSMSPEQISAIAESYPDAQMHYSVKYGEQSLSSADESLDLTGLLHENVESVVSAVSYLPRLKTIVLGSEGNGSFSWDDVKLISAACPNAELDFAFNFMGQPVNLKDEALNMSHVQMSDEGASVRALLPLMKNCTYLDMDFCGVSNSAMESIRNDFPDIKVVWRIWFGDNYSVRTDVERVLASKPSKGGYITDEQIQVLKYCTDLKYLDLGHNNSIYDLSFLYGTPNIEVLVLAMNPFTDITPLASCPKLEYIELNSTQVSDLSPLSGLTELRHLNLGNCANVCDITPLYGLTELERLWIGSIDPVPAEQVAQMQANAPNCVIDTVTVDPTAGTWRISGYTELSLALYDQTGWLQEVLHPRYELLKEQFGYTDADFSFTWNDPLY